MTPTAPSALHPAGTARAPPPNPSEFPTGCFAIGEEGRGEAQGRAGTGQRGGASQREREGLFQLLLHEVFRG